MKDSLYTLGYATALGMVCALLLAGTDRITRPYKQANEKAKKVRNILDVLGVPFARDASAHELVATFDKNVRVEQRGELTAYVYSGPGDGATAKAAAVPFAGPGLWGPIEGFLALEADGTTVRGVTFHKQEETPGLGGEIGARWFRDQFKGKRIVSETGRPGMRIRRGGRDGGPNEVDAITGATMTCDKVEAMLNRIIAKIIEERGNHGD